MPPTVDELLEALPEVGLQLWMLDQCDANVWHAAVCDPKAPGKDRWDGVGGTPCHALQAALLSAGVNISDDEAPF